MSYSNVLNHEKRNCHEYFIKKIYRSKQVFESNQVLIFRKEFSDFKFHEIRLRIKVVFRAEMT